MNSSLLSRAAESLVSVAVLAPTLALALLPAAGAMLLATLAPVAWHWRRSRRQDSAMPPQKNPAELGPAMLIAALYALILFGLAAARRYLGHDALYLVSVVAGLTDVDAIVLSVSRFVAEGTLPDGLGWRLALVGRDRERLRSDRQREAGRDTDAATDGPGHEASKRHVDPPWLAATMRCGMCAATDGSVTSGQWCWRDNLKIFTLSTTKRTAWRTRLERRRSSALLISAGVWRFMVVLIPGSATSPGGPWPCR